jgi:NAD(P)-dependent dehydrogenase (short-subunit alcohol dehydrogenase family)
VNGRVGIVTGGGKGLGRAFAVHLAARGAAVVVSNRNDSADGVVAEIEEAGGRACAEYSDVADPGAGDRIVRTALDTYGRLDFLVTSAAISGPAMFHRSSVAALRDVLTVNVLGTAGVAMAASAHMRANGGGRIVLVASTAGLHGETTVSAYAASKGAVIALGRTIAQEGAPRDVLTNVLLPYATTQMTDTNMDTRFRDVMTADSVAPVVAALVDPASRVNGEVIVAANGAIRATGAVEWGTVRHPSTMDPATLERLIAESRAGKPHEYRTAQDAFVEFAQEGLR